MSRLRVRGVEQDVVVRGSERHALLACLLACFLSFFLRFGFGCWLLWACMHAHGANGVNGSDIVASLSASIPDQR